MAKSLFNLAEHTIVERVLRPGNYLAKIVKIEIKDVGQGSQFYFEFNAVEGRHTEGFWYQHRNEDAQRIGRNQIKRIGIQVGESDLDLQENPNTWEPLKNKPIAIAVRREKDKDGSFLTFTKDGKTYDSYTIEWFAKSKDELPSYDPDFEEDDEDDAPAVKPQTPDVDQIMKNVSRGGNHEPAGSHADPPAGAPNPKEEPQVEDDVPF